MQVYQKIKEVLDQILGLPEGGMTMIVLTHEMRFAKEVADKILSENPSFKSELVYFHGHLFEQDRKVKDHGVLVVTK